MQIIEATAGWIRSAGRRMRRRGTPLEFVLYPMIHIGSPAFYAEVSRRLAAADLVVAEGAGIDYGSLGVPVIRADMRGDEFDARRRTVPSTEPARRDPLRRVPHGWGRLRSGSRSGVVNGLWSRHGYRVFAGDWLTVATFG